MQATAVGANHHQSRGDDDHRTPQRETRWWRERDCGDASQGTATGPDRAAQQPARLRHQRVFGTILAMMPYGDPGRNAAAFMLGGNTALARANSPSDYVRTMRRTLGRFPLRVFIYGGRDDAETSEIPAMAAALKAEGADESWAVYAGGHSWNTWTPHVDQMLIMASHDFHHPLR